MENKLIIAIDPGDKYVGVCCWYNGKIIVETIDGTYIDGALKGIFEVADKLISYDERYRLKVDRIMVIEKYLNYNHKTQIKGYKENKTSHLIGALQMCEMMGWTIVMQTASQAKNWTDERLMRLGFMQKVGNKFIIANQPTTRHCRDAVRHLIYYTNKNLFNNTITKDKLIWKD